MIFQEKHIDMILSGVKTQTRRINRGKYTIGKSYSLQPCRICKGIEDYRIVMDRIWEEKAGLGLLFPRDIEISFYDAHAEGGYTEFEYEQEFRKAYPKWNGKNRWAFEFHVIEVYTNEEKESYREFDDAQKELDKER